VHQLDNKVIEIFMVFESEYFSKICEKIQVSLKSDMNSVYLT